MADQSIQRRLAAILAADVVGYSAAMEANEDATITAWKAARTEIIDPKITEHRGRIVKHTGDGLPISMPTLTREDELVLENVVMGCCSFVDAG